MHYAASTNEETADWYNELISCKALELEKQNWGKGIKILLSIQIRK